MSYAAECTRVYTPSGHVAHLRPPYVGLFQTLCPVMPKWPGEFLGTGSQGEYDRAAALPTCSRCALHARGENEYRAEPCQWSADVCTLADCRTHRPKAGAA